MAMTCLQIVQAVCRRIGTTAPAAAVTSSDLAVQQIVELANEEGQELAARYSWQALQTEATFTTVAAQVQGAMSTIAPGWLYVVNDTIWNRTLRRPVYGPRSEQEWQQDKAMQINGPFNSYRIIADSINFYPNPVAGQTCAFEYVSANWVRTTSSTSSTWTADTDTPKLEDVLIVLGTVWRWKQAKGLSYQEDFNKYERRLMDRANRDASKPILNMTGAKYEIEPVILVPRGNW